MVCWWWSETVSIKGAPPRLVEPYGWGISVSNSGEVHLSAVNETAQALYESLGGDRKPLGDVNYWWDLD